MKPLEIKGTHLSSPNFSIGNKIMLFRDNSDSIYCYNVDEDEWTVETCPAIENLHHFAWLKIPYYFKPFKK